MKTTEKKVPSQTQMRVKVQELLQNNLRQAIGMFHSKELNEFCFLNDLFKNFDLTPKQKYEKHT